MPTALSTPETMRQDANELYWNSERTVDEIMGDLGIGKRALYASVRPIPAGASCPHCGDPMMYTNRSSRDAGRAVCSACDLSASTADLAGAETTGSTSREEWSAPSPGELNGYPERAGMLSRWREDLAQVEPQRAAMVGGAAALGVVVGAAAARAVREML